MSNNALHIKLGHLVKTGKQQVGAQRAISENVLACTSESGKPPESIDLEAMKNEINELKSADATQKDLLDSMSTRLKDAQQDIAQLKQAVSQIKASEIANKEVVCEFLTEIESLVKSSKDSSAEDFNKKINSYRTVPEAERSRLVLENHPTVCNSIFELLNPYPKNFGKPLRKYLEEVMTKIEAIKQQINCIPALNKDRA